MRFLALLLKKEQVLRYDFTSSKLAFASSIGEGYASKRAGGGRFRNEVHEIFFDGDLHAARCAEKAVVRDCWRCPSVPLS